MENAFACELRCKFGDGQSGFRAIVKASACVMQLARRPSDCLLRDGWQKTQTSPIYRRIAADL
jgi:hypothetical protein